MNMHKLTILILFILSGFSSLAQAPFRGVMQAPNTIHKTPYGNNPSAGHYVQANDAKIYYEVYGSATHGKKQPIVILHGGILGSTIEMANFIDSLKQNFQVIAISTRGHGKSEIGSLPITYEKKANDVMAVINAITPTKPLFWALVMGHIRPIKWLVCILSVSKK
jgi:predicted alpha/beta-fold hydrolase